MALHYTFLCPLQNGVHARPASALEEVTSRFLSEITLSNLRNGLSANGKSILAIVGLDLRRNDPCKVIIGGPDEKDAYAAISAFLEKELPASDDEQDAIAASRGEHPLHSVLQDSGVSIRRGIPVVSGIGKGRIVHVTGLRVPPSLPEDGAADFATEVRKLDAALISLAAAYEDRLTRDKSTVELDLIKSHGAMARDPEFRSRLHETLRLPGRTAAGAIAETESYFRSRFLASESALLHERVLDLRDVAFQLLRQIHGTIASESELALEGDSIVVAEFLTPEQFLKLDRTRVKGLVLGRAGNSSHTVILARSFGIPTLTGMPDLAFAILHGLDAVLDANAGVLVTHLTESARNYYHGESLRLEERKSRQCQFSQKPGTTQGGHRVEIATAQDLLPKALSSTTSSEVRRLLDDPKSFRSAPLIEPDMILIGSSAATKAEAIRQVVDRLYVLGRTGQPRAIEQAVWERESICATGFGCGFAIPHCKTNAVASNSVAVLKLKQPIPWDFPDNHPVQIIFLLAIRGSGQSAGHMKILSALARQVVHEEFRERIALERDPSALCDFLKERLSA